MPAFDYQAAKAKGYTDEQITAFLRAKRAEGIDLYIPKESLGDAGAQLIPTPSLARRLATRAAGFGPTIGGFLGGIGGGMAGAPGGPFGAYAGAVGGAAAGGALGEAGKRLYTGEPLSPSEIGLRGAEQGAYEALGGALMAGAGKLASSQMKSALKPVISSLAIRFKTTPEAIAQIMLRGRYTVTTEGYGAASQAGQVARAAREATLSRAGGSVTPQRLAATVIRDAERNAGRALTAKERKFLIQKVEREANDILTQATHGAVSKAQNIPPRAASTVLNQYGQPAIAATPGRHIPSRYSYRELEQIKEVAADAARGSYKADATSVAADPILARQMADRARRLVGRVPGVKAQTASIRESMIVEQGIRRALTKSSEWTPIHVGPVGSPVWLKIPPGKRSEFANFINTPGFKRVLRQTPRGAVALLQQMGYTDEQDTTAGF